MHLLRNRRLLTARDIAEQLEVSVRTIYRDVSDLMLSGVPIEGEAGIGYSLRRGSDIPPLMFSADELEALVLGARIVRSWADSGLRRAAGAALTKIEAVLPPELKQTLASAPLFAPDAFVPESVHTAMDELRRAIREQRRVALEYTRADGVASSRVVEPLGLFFWGRSWSLAAWCHLRDNFRNFRLDRIGACEVLDQHFEATPGRTLADFFVAMENE